MISYLSRLLFFIASNNNRDKQLPPASDYIYIYIYILEVGGGESNREIDFGFVFRVRDRVVRAKLCAMIFGMLGVPKLFSPPAAAPALAGATSDVRVRVRNLDFDLDFD